MRKACLHNIVLPKGLRCNHGYLEVLMTVNGQRYCKTFGQHTKQAEEVAKIHLADKQREFKQNKLNGIIGIKPELPSKKFEEVAKIWFEIWKQECNPDGTEKHNLESAYKVNWTLKKVLIKEFGQKNFHEVSSRSIQIWREREISNSKSGITLNRYQAILSSIYSHISDWVKCERIKPGFKLPLENPCKAVEMAPTQKRERILTHYEAKKLKNAFIQLNDTNGWEICKMALKSVLSLKDLKSLKIGDTIDIERSKTGVPVEIPTPVLVKLNWYGWRTRWEKARELAGLKDLQFRDLRKSGINNLKGHFDLKLISEYAGHANIRTTEKNYIINQVEKLRPLAEAQENWINNL